MKNEEIEKSKRFSRVGNLGIYTSYNKTRFNGRDDVFFESELYEIYFPLCVNKMKYICTTAKDLNARLKESRFIY